MNCLVHQDFWALKLHTMILDCDSKILGLRIIEYIWSQWTAKHKFLLNFLWWSDCYISISSYVFPWRYNTSMVFLIAIDIRWNETFCFNICFTIISPTLTNTPPQFQISYFFKWEWDSHLPIQNINEHLMNHSFATLRNDIKNHFWALLEFHFDIHFVPQFNLPRQHLLVWNQQCKHRSNV